MDAKAKCGMPGLAVQPESIGRFEFLGIAIDQRFHLGAFLTRFNPDPLERPIPREGWESRPWRVGRLQLLIAMWDRGGVFAQKTLILGMLAEMGSKERRLGQVGVSKGI